MLGDTFHKVVAEDNLDLQLPLLLLRGKFGLGIGKVGGVGDDPGGGGSVDEQVVERDEDKVDRGLATGGKKNLIVESIDPILRTNRLQSLLSVTDVPFLSGRCFTLDTSLERVFGGGATRLAIELDGLPNMESVHNISDSSGTDSIPLSASSTPGTDGSLRRDVGVERMLGLGI